ncbi:MAG: hypothetical protein ACSHX8_04155 [Opitutaceae bacterium]
MKNFYKHTFLQALALALCVAYAASTPLVAQTNSNWKQQAEKWIEGPLTVSWKNGNAVSTVSLVAVRDGQLSFQVGQQAGEASMPLDTLGDIWFTHQTAEGYNSAIGLIGKESFNLQHLNLIRETAYPMVRFLQVPTENSSFIEVVSKLADGLIQLKQLEEAAFLINQLEISELGPDFEAHTINLAKEFVEAGAVDEATKIIGKIAIERMDLSNTDLIFDLAHLLRNQENFVDSRNIYQQLAKNSAIENNSAIHWSYYCGLKEGDFIKDHDFPQEVETISPGSPNYPLQQLVLGIYYSKRDQDKEAMRAISQGIAFATPVEAWTPELMFRSAQAYQSVDMADISKSVYTETIRFFPTSSWAAAAQKELAK